MAQFVAIGGGAQYPRRYRERGQQGPSAQEMLASIMQTGQQDRVSTAEALAMVIPLLQGAMGQQNFSAQLAQQGSQFTENLDFARGQADRANQLAQDTLSRQPTPEERIAEILAALGPSQKTAEAALQQAKTQGDAIAAQLEESRAERRKRDEDRNLLLLQEAAAGQIGDVGRDTEQDLRTLAANEFDAAAEVSAGTSDAVRSALASVENRVSGRANPLTRGFARVYDALTPDGPNPAPAREIRDIIYPADLDLRNLIADFYAAKPHERYGMAALQALETVANDSTVTKWSSEPMLRRAKQVVHSKEANEVRAAERARELRLEKERRRIDTDAREQEDAIRDAARRAQRGILAGEEDLAGLLQGIQLQLQGGGTGSPRPTPPAAPTVTTGYDPMDPLGLQTILQGAP